jgi:hypothetical protein
MTTAWRRWGIHAVLAAAAGVLAYSLAGALGSRIHTLLWGILVPGDGVATLLSEELTGLSGTSLEVIGTVANALIFSGTWLVFRIAGPRARTARTFTLGLWVVWVAIIAKTAWDLG